MFKIQDNDTNVENFVDETIVKVDHEFGHRLKREANDKKKKPKPKVSNKIMQNYYQIELLSRNDKMLF